jgi:hypothetical protein
MPTRTLPFPAPLDCAAVDERLPDWLDDPASDAGVARHVAACARCGPLVAELRAVSAAAGELPPMEPPAHLWADIAVRLGAQDGAARDVVPLPLPAADPPRVRHLRRRDLPPAWRLAAAAVALVAVTAGVTYRVARETAPAVAAVAPSAAPGATNDAAAPAGELAAAGTPDVAAGRDEAAVDAAPADRSPAAERRADARALTRRPGRRATPAAGLTLAAASPRRGRARRGRLRPRDRRAPRRRARAAG